jgi:hypothetical protein
MSRVKKIALLCDITCYSLLHLGFMLRPWHMVFQIQIVNVTMSSMLGFVGHRSLTNEVYQTFLCWHHNQVENSTYCIFTCVLSILKCGVVNKVWVWNGNSCITYVPPVCVGDTKDSSLWGGIWPPHQYYQGRRWLWGEYNCAGILIQTFFISVKCAHGFEHVQLLNNEKNFTLCSVAQSHWMLNPDIQQSVQALHHFVNVYMLPVTHFLMSLWKIDAFSERSLSPRKFCVSH